MSKTIVLAEKPSVARELAAVLGNSVGSLILPLLAMLGQNGKAEE